MRRSHFYSQDCLDSHFMDLGLRPGISARCWALDLELGQNYTEFGQIWPNFAELG